MLSHGRFGLALCAAGAAAVALAAADAESSRPGPVVALIVAAAVAGVAGRLVAGAAPWLPPLLAAAAAAIGLPPFLPEAGEPLAAPLGYANADGTLFVLGALAALSLGVGRGVPVAVRPVAIGAVGLLSVATLATRSAASLVLLGAGAGLVVVAVAGPRVAAVAGGLAAVGVLAATGVVAALYAGDVGGNAVGVRVALWRDGLAVAADHPFTGVGPGLYEAVQRVTDDPDLRWAHHGPLQVAAELGVVGLAVLAGAVGWALLRGARAHPTPAAAALAATTVLVVHACVDYVLHAGALSVLAAFLVGGAVPRRPLSAAGGDGDAQPG